MCLLFKSANYRSRLVPPPLATNRSYLRSEIDRFELRICAGASHFHIQVPTSAAYYPRFLPLFSLSLSSPTRNRSIRSSFALLVSTTSRTSLESSMESWEVSRSLSLHHPWLPSPFLFSSSSFCLAISHSLSLAHTLSLSLSLSGPLIAFVSSDVVRLPI